jgi:hypothetical protein
VVTFGMSMMAWKGCTRAAYGGVPLHSSMAVIPALHTSAQPSYADCWITCDVINKFSGSVAVCTVQSDAQIEVCTSGAIQNGVPTLVCLLSILSVS